MESKTQLFSGDLPQNVKLKYGKYKGTKGVQALFTVSPPPLPLPLPSPPPLPRKNIQMSLEQNPVKYMLLGLDKTA